MLKFELNEHMVRVISECLSNGPYRVVGPVIAELQRQINEQGAGPQPPAESSMSLPAA